MPTQRNGEAKRATRCSLSISMLCKASLFILFPLHALMCALVELAFEALSLFFVAARIESPPTGLNSTCLDSRLGKYSELALQR